MTIKIGLLASQSISDFRIKTLLPILRDENYAIEVAIIDKQPQLSLKEKLKKNWKRGRGGYMLIMAIKSYLKKKTNDCSTIEFCIKNNVKIIETDDPYSHETIENIKTKDLDVLILVGGFGIVKVPLLSVTRMGVLSYHHGDMRKYRGMPMAFWELYNNESEMGITLQILSSSLDKGIPVEEKKIPIFKNDDLKSLKARAFNESIGLLYMALLKISRHDFVPVSITNYGKVYTLPDFRQWILLNLKVIWRRLKREIN